MIKARTQESEVGGNY